MTSTASESRWRRRTVLVIAVGFILAMAWLWRLGSVAIVSRVVEVENVAVEVLGAGELVPAKRVSISAAVDGVVEELEVSAGDSIFAAEVLLRLSNPAVQRAAQNAVASCAAAQAEVEARVLETHGAALELRQEQRMAQQDLNLALAQLRAREQLVERGVSAALDVEQARAAAAQAQLRLESATSRAAVQPRIDQARDKAARAEAELTCAGADQSRSLAEALLVRSPLDGAIASLSVQLGDAVNEGQVLAEVHDRGLEAEVSVIENSGRELRTGLRAFLTAAGVSLTGTITRLVSGDEPGVIRVRIKLDEVPQGLRAGALVGVRIPTEKSRDRMFVRAAAALPRGVAQVTRIRRGEREPVEIRLEAPAADGSAEVQGELQAGDELEWQA